jgi:hypothetical protein
MSKTKYAWVGDLQVGDRFLWSGHVCTVSERVYDGTLLIIIKTVGGTEISLIQHPDEQVDLVQKKR